MENVERRTLLFVDYEAVRATLGAADPGAGPVGEKAAEFARAHGRLLAGTLYGDVGPEPLKALRRAGVEVRITEREGDGSAPESIALALDAAHALAAGPACEVVVLLTDDAQLAELVRRLRRYGRYVAIVVPDALAASDLARSADRAVLLSALLAGGVPVELPTPASAPAPARRELRARPAAVVAPAAPTEPQDWTRLVVLLRDIEAKMPFVGMRWLKNKVLGPHNVGTVSPNDKQTLLNRAVDEGILETYRVDNREEGGEPVTACRLLRGDERVKTILAAHPETATVAVVEGTG